jgi:hypothetical protein
MYIWYLIIVGHVVLEALSRAQAVSTFCCKKKKKKTETL